MTQTTVGSIPGSPGRSIPGSPGCSMRAAVLVEPGRIELQERPVPSPQPGDVLVRFGVVGVCGSDAHYYREGRIGEFVVEAPLILGHEAGGVVAAVGAGVPEERIGQRVSIEPQRPDRDSEETRGGRYNLCPQMRFYATPPVDGAFCEYVTIGAAFAHPVPDTVSDDAAALCEPLSLGIAAIRKAGIAGGSRVPVAGTGPIGIMMVQVAKAYGATDIIVADLDENRRAIATRFGANTALDPRVDDVCGRQVDAFVDASGAPAAVAAGIAAVRPAGRVDLDGMVTARFPLEKAAEALEADRTPGNVKAVVEVADHR